MMGDQENEDPQEFKEPKEKRGKTDFLDRKERMEVAITWAPLDCLGHKDQADLLGGME